jgi:transcriptional regulator with XRE-family HTH domain
MALGEAVRELRKEADLTLEQLADKAEVRFQLVSDLERGMTNPMLTTLARICTGLDVKLSDLVLRMETIADSRGE